MLKLLLNTFFTGGRTFKITYTLDDNSSNSVTTSKYSKGAYCLDILDLAGLTSDDVRTKVRSITFAQSNANGGARIYDMYVSVPTNSTDGIKSHEVYEPNETHKTNRAHKTHKILQEAGIVIIKDGQRYNAIGQKIY